MLKKYYLTNEAGNRIFVGYKIKNLEHLHLMGYHVSPLTEEYFIKARKRGTVYLSKTGYHSKETEVFFFDNKGIMIGTAYKNKEGGQNDY